MPTNNQSNEDFIKNHFVVLLLGVIATVSLAVVGILSYLDDHYIRSEKLEVINTKLDISQKSINTNTNRLLKDIKGSKMYGLRFRRKVIISIPETKRTEREKTELNLINDELKTLNAE